MIGYADLAAWYFRTDASGTIRDLNFFQDAGAGCYVNGQFTLILGVYCGGGEVASLRLTNLVSLADAKPVPTLHPTWLAVLMLALAVVAGRTVRRRCAIRTR